MSHHYYHLARGYMGRPVEVLTREWRRHRGIITRVTPSHMYLNPIAGAIADVGAETHIQTADLMQSNPKGTAVLFSPFLIPFASIAALSLWWW